jgi:SAM-dependent methyltransferase
MADARLVFPATARNREPILAVLRGVLPEAGTVLEIASGSGEHVTQFARAFPHLVFQPSDPNAECRASVDAWAAHEGLANIRPAAALDVTAAAPWPLAQAGAVICINMIHIAPWAAAEGLMAGAARLLAPGGALYLYGPYQRGGAHTAPSNAAFDAGLRAQNPAWGVRNLEDVAGLAARAGFVPPEIIPMPANNLSLIFRKTERQGRIAVRA